MTTETNTAIETTLNPVEQAILNFQSRMAKDEQSCQNFQVQGWLVVWEQVQEAYRVARSIITDVGNKAHFEAALEKADLKPASEKANKWLPVTKLLFGSWDGTNTVFTPDRSAEKYANYFRYFDTNSVLVEHVVDTIRGAVHGDLRYLKAIEKMDREASGSGSGKGFTPEQKLSAGTNRNADGVFKISKPALVPDDAAYGTLVFERVGDEIVVLSCETLTKEVFETKAKKRGAALLAAVNEAAKSVALEMALGQKKAA